MKKKQPIISIIIPTFNASPFLSRVLDSLIAQSIKNFEVIVVDGDSKDKTLKIAEDYVSEFPTLRIYSEKDLGIYDAMNKGISYAKGDWIYFLGSDDYLYEDKVLEKLVLQMEVSNYDIIYGNVHSNFYKGIYDGEFSYKKLTEQNICHQAIFFKKHIFNKTGKFDLNYKVAADWDHNIKWFFNSRIKRQYVDLVIAEFSDGGYSYLNEDLLFEAHKNLKLIKVGFLKLPVRTLKKLCKTEKTNLSKTDAFGKKMLVEFYYVLMKIRLKLITLANSPSL